MKWCITICDKNRKIQGAQQYLFKKYNPDAELFYLDMGNKPTDFWCINVLDLLPNDELIVFGLEDFLPIAPIDKEKFEQACEIVRNSDVERFELSWGAARRGAYNNGHGYVNREHEGIKYLSFHPEMSYTISCQFSIWKTKVLKNLLRQFSTPWKFEVKGKCKAACFEKAVFRYIEEGALSAKWDGYNVMGLRMSDIQELLNLKLLDKNNLYFVGQPGSKYREFYEDGIYGNIW